MLDDVTNDEIAAVKVPFEAAATLAEYYREHPPTFWVGELAGDLKRQFGEDGFELFLELLDEHEPDLVADVVTYAREVWETYDGGRPLVAELNRAKRNGWKIPAHRTLLDEPDTPVAARVDAILDELAALSGARRAQREVEWRRTQDADHAEWLASGEPDWFEERKIRAQEQRMSMLSVVPQVPAPDMIRSSGDFVRGFVPPEYLLDGILQRRFCYSMTAQTGVGKTTVAMLLAAHVSIGRPLGSIVVEKGPVLYFAGENPDDIRMRWLGLTRELRIDPDNSDVHFVPGVVPFSQVAASITAEVQRKGIKPALVVVDTSAAYFEGDNDNDNVQQGAHARMMRSLTLLPGGPCVLVLCHPTKRAGDDDLLPRGGGAFLNEVDGNIALRKSDTIVAAQAQGKFRGPEFQPLRFQLKVVRDHPALVDAKGKQIPTVIAHVADELTEMQVVRAGRDDENQMLKVIDRRAGSSATDAARALGWTYGAAGTVHRNRAERALKRLLAEKLVRESRGGWHLTSAGEKELNQIDVRCQPPALPLPR